MANRSAALPTTSGTSGMQTVTSVPGDVGLTSKCPSAASTFVRVEAMPICPLSTLRASFSSEIPIPSSAIRNVAAGDAVVAPSATRRLLAHVVRSLPGESDNGQRDKVDLLTSREVEVLQQIAAGATNAEIASTLYMAEGTVKTHIGRLLSKLDCRDRVSLVLFAFEAGLADPYAPR